MVTRRVLSYSQKPHYLLQYHRILSGWGHAGTEYAACVPSPSVFCPLVVCDFSQKAKRIHGNHSKRSASSRVVSPKKGLLHPAFAKTDLDGSLYRGPKSEGYRKDIKVESRRACSVHIAQYAQSKAHVSMPTSP